MGLYGNLALHFLEQNLIQNDKLLCVKQNYEKYIQYVSLPPSVTTNRSVCLSPLKSPNAAKYPSTAEIPTLSVTSLKEEDTCLQKRNKKPKQRGIRISSFVDLFHGRGSGRGKLKSRWRQLLPQKSTQRSF